MRHGKYDLPLDNSDSTFSTGQSAMSASRPETFDKLFMASVGRVSRFESQQIFRFVITGSGLPAAVNDPYPFERQCPDRRLMRFALFSEALIIQFGPV